MKLKFDVQVACVVILIGIFIIDWRTDKINRKLDEIKDRLRYA